MALPEASPTPIQKQETFPVEMLGKLSPEFIMNSDRTSLERILETHSLSVDELITPEGQRSGQSSKAGLPLDDRIRIALMYGGGRTWGEITHAFLPKFPKTERKQLEVRLKHSVRWLSPPVMALGHRLKTARKEQPALEENDAVTKSRLDAVAALAGLRKEQLFFYSEEGKGARRADTGVTPIVPHNIPRGEHETIYNARYVAYVLHRYYCENAPARKIEKELQEMLGEQIKLKMGEYLRNLLTPEAQKALKPHMPA